MFDLKKNKIKSNENKQNIKSVLLVDSKTEKKKKIQPRNSSELLSRFKMGRPPGKSNDRHFFCVHLVLKRVMLDPQQINESQITTPRRVELTVLLGALAWLKDTSCPLELA